MRSSGHLVVFDDDGSYVLNNMTGEVNLMREECGNHFMNLWVMPNEGKGFYEATPATKNDERVRPTDDTLGKSKGVAGECDGAIVECRQ